MAGFSSQRAGRSSGSSTRGPRRRLLFLGWGLDEASWRFRIAQYVPYLRERGVEVESADLRGPLVRRLRLLASAAHFDAVCVHRVLLSAVEQRWLHRAAPHYVFDFDDALMFRDSAAARFASWQRRGRLARMLHGAGAVIAGNAYLADWARAHHPRVTIVPTAIDLADYPAQPRAADGPVIGWMGTRSNLPYVRTLLPAFAQLAARHPDLRVRIVSNGALDAPHLPVVNKAWTRADEAADLHGFQIGIMPLPDDPWTRGKCAVKLLQYFAARLPVVCSPVGVNRDVVEHGRNGFFARTDAEWVDRLEELLSDPSLRQRFCEHGRAVVAQRFCVETTLPRLLQVLLNDS